MKALQYIYTSWKNGDSLDKGYMIYSKSLGITDDECECIKEVMQYMPPKGLKMNPTSEEIANDFPYNFAYFILPSGRVCVANTTYIGKDYSGRFGNYIIYALIFEYDELTTYPVELFAEAYIKTFMTDEELNATPPIPALPAISINDSGNVINSEIIMEFVGEREDDCAYLISAILESIKLKKPIYIYDTRENLVLWMAVIQKMLPLKNAKKFTFSTYIGNHEQIRSNSKVSLSCIGVRPDANYFDYRQEKESSRHIVIDYINNIKTNIIVNDFSIKISQYLGCYSENLDKFKQFIYTSSYADFDERLITAFEFYRIIDENAKIDNEILLDLIRFGETYCQSSENTSLATKMLEQFQKNLPSVSILDMKALFAYLFKYAGYMLSTIYSVLFDFIFVSVETMTLDDTSKIRDFFESCKKDMELFTSGYFDYFTSEEGINAANLYLKGNRNLIIIQYYLLFILENYNLFRQTNSNRPIFGLFHTLLNELYRLNNATENVIAVMELLVNNSTLYAQIMFDYRKILTNIKEFDIFYSEIIKQLKVLNTTDSMKFEKLIIQNPQYRDIATELFSKKIQLSSSPENEFEYYAKMFTEDSTASIKISSLINTYLKTLNEEKRLTAAVKIFKSFDEDIICSNNVLNNIIEAIEINCISEICKVDVKLLDSIDRICKKFNVTDDIIHAVIYGETLLKLKKYPYTKDDLAKKLNDYSFNIDKLSGKSYEIYLKKYLEPILCCINDEFMLDSIFNQFYHKRYSELLFSFYINHLKALEKKKDSKFESLVVYACNYIIRNVETPIGKRFEPYLITYLHKFKEEYRSSVESLVKRNNLSYTSVFFAKVNDEEKKKGLFSGIFKKM